MLKKVEDGITMKWPTLKEVMEIKNSVKTKKNKDIKALKKDSLKWIRTSWANKLSYENTWLGIPIIQIPEDIIIMQELIFTLKPDIIIELGIGHGGSLIFYSSLLELFGKGIVVGVDIEIREHNKKAIINHPLSKRIIMIEGNSTDHNTIKKVEKYIDDNKIVLICLDSNHTKSHVLSELKLYSKYISPGSYIVVFDTIMPKLIGLPGSHDKWKDDNPMEAINDFLSINDEFEIDTKYNKLYVTYCPNGFLRRKK